MRSAFPDAQVVDDTIDLAEVARNMRRGWRMILWGLVLGLAVAAAVLLFVPPKFFASSSVVLRAQESSSGSLTARLGGSLAGAAAGLLPGGLTSSPIETEIQILSSRALASEVVDSLLLQVRVRSAHRLPAVGIFEAVGFPGSFRKMTLDLRRNASGGYTVTGQGPAVELRPGIATRVGSGSLTLVRTALPEQFSVDVFDRQEAITNYQKRLSVGKAGGEVVSISYSADDSLTAAVVPNLAVRRYLTLRRTTDRGTNGRRVEFLSFQVDSVERQLAEAEHALRAQQERSGVVDPVVVGKLELERAGELRNQSGTLDVERGALKQMLAQLGTGDLSNSQLAAFPTFLKSPGINELLGQLNTLQTKRLQLLATLTAEDPAVVATSEAIKNIESQIPSMARAYATSLDRQRADVAKQLDTLRSAIEQLPAMGEAAVRLQRRVLGLGQVSAALRAQLVEARLATVGEGGDVRVLDVAEPPRKVGAPKVSYTLAGGIGGGLLLGMIGAIFAGSYGRYVPDARTIERQIGVPALHMDAAIPLLVATPGDLRTLLLIPLEPGVDTHGVAERLMRTAVSRGLRGTIVDLAEHRSNEGVLMRDLDRLGEEFDLVVVRLPELSSDGAIGALRESRPVLFVAEADRVDRRKLSAAVETLDRLSVPCAGVVLSRQRAKALVSG